MTLLKFINRRIKVLLFAVLLIGVTSKAYSQAQYQNATPPSQVGNEIDDEDLNQEIDELAPLDDPDPLNVPFDGGATILIASGVAYGAKKYKERKSRKTEETERK